MKKSEFYPAKAKTTTRLNKNGYITLAIAAIAVTGVYRSIELLEARQEATARMTYAPLPLRNPPYLMSPLGGSLLISMRQYSR